MPDISMVAQLCQKLAKTVIAVKEVNWPGAQQILKTLFSMSHLQE